MLGIDVYKNGVHMAVVQSYQSDKLKDGMTYRVELHRVYRTIEAIKTGWWFGEDDFDVVIENNCKKIIYRHCLVAERRWVENGYWDEIVIESVCREETNYERP